MLQELGKRVLELEEQLKAAEARERALREALESIANVPGKPFPDPVAHSERAFGDAVWRAFIKIQGITRNALDATPAPAVAQESKPLKGETQCQE